MHLMSNQPSVETQIVGLGLEAPRIKPEQIDAMVQRLSFHTYVIPGTTATVAAAIDPLGFVVALGQASAVSPANFNESLGRNAAISKAKRAAFDELFKLEGYRLKHNLCEAAATGLISELSLHLAADPALSADPTLAPGLALGHALVGGHASVAY